MRSINFLLTLAVFFITITSFSQSSTNGTGGGDWSNANTWNPSGVPAANVSITIVAGDRLIVDQNATVDDLTYNYEDCATCTLRVESGNTLTLLDDMILIATDDKSKAKIIIEGDLDVGDDVRIIPTSTYDELEVTFESVSGGDISITDRFAHASALASSTNKLTI